MKLERFVERVKYTVITGENASLLQYSRFSYEKNTI